jgi:hypothetical protein
MKVKRDKRDIVFSHMVRERAEHTCEWCGKFCGEKHENGRLDCSHIFSRRHKATRWHPDNAVAHCFTCHQTYGENPVAANRWLLDHFGGGYMEILEEKKNSIVKRSKPVREDLYKHLQSEYKRMMSLRSDGVTGRIEFESFD